MASILLIASLLLYFSTETFQFEMQRIWPAHYTDSHRDLHLLVESSATGRLNDFEVVVPFRTDVNYNHVTYVVRHRRPSRLRRDTSVKPENEEIRYSISGFGEVFQLHLEPNHGLLAPNFKVTKVKNQTEEQVAGNDVNGCHYHGWISSHNRGGTAMSTCEGLNGLLRTSNNDFLIEPIENHLNHSFDHPIQPHIIYKRRHQKKGNHPLHFCGVKRQHPVPIFRSADDPLIRLLSDGEIELEATRKRTRRSLVSRAEESGRNSGGFFANTSRPRRKTIETLVVADRDLIANHERDQHDVTIYILTVMNMVSSLFIDSTLDDGINIVVAEMILLEDNDSLVLDHKADRSLNNFCEWQYNLKRNRTTSWDHSILLTGLDICVHKNSPCQTLGLAQIGGMCSESHSCTINEDFGLGLAFTIAHETGHSFGMRHDGQGNTCSSREGHIMSPTLNGANGVFTWSECSRETFRYFFNDDSSICLDNHPASPDDFNSHTNQLPGRIYGAEVQCQWQFGPDAQPCHFHYDYNREEMCKVLWCQRDGGRVCETKYMPPAEGTPCGDGRWCRRGVCVPEGSDGPEAIDGTWAAYGPWSSCTRSCGGGVRNRKRSCTNPSPRYGGRNCAGRNKIYEMCNVQKCSPSQIDYRSLQCSAYNSKPYRRRFFNWVPFTKYTNFGRDSCDLLCKAEGYGFFDMLSDKVEDGTPCKEDSNDVCIDGKCQHVGCDYVLGSNATYDICGVCNGDNTTCDLVQGNFNRSIKLTGYYKVVRIPRGALNVRVWEDKCCTHSYIAIKDAAFPGDYFLNGNWRINLNPPSTIAGARWVYHRKGFEGEYLYSLDPLLEDIVIEVLVISENPGIKYSFSLPKIRSNIPGSNGERIIFPSVYNWNVTYNSCSASCAGGIQTPFVTCFSNETTIADEVNCDIATRPAASVRKCNVFSCPARWQTTRWSDCSQSCGVGKKSRWIQCKALTVNGDKLLRTRHCKGLKPPKTVRGCKKRSCPAIWQAGEWSKCSRKCGKGRRKRKVYCRRGGRKVGQSACDRTSRPRRRERCKVARCLRQYEWSTTPWGKCSSTCGRGRQKRKLKCSRKRKSGKYLFVANRRCHSIRKPKTKLKKRCFVRNCIANVRKSSNSITNIARRTDIPQENRFPANWIAGPWQQCSSSCGGGRQMRRVECLQFGNLSKLCPTGSRPASRRPCNTYQCNSSANNESLLSNSLSSGSLCRNNFSWCDLVPAHGQCSNRYFESQCCEACSKSRD